MEGTLRGSAFNQLLDSWDVSIVIDMDGMFRDNTPCNQPLNFWDASRVNTMEEMLRSAAAFDRPPNSWDVSNVICASRMFRRSAFNEPLDSRDITNVTRFKPTDELLRRLTRRGHRKHVAAGVQPFPTPEDLSIVERILPRELRPGRNGDSNQPVSSDAAGRSVFAGKTTEDDREEGTTERFGGKRTTERARWKVAASKNSRNGCGKANEARNRFPRQSRESWYFFSFFSSVNTLNDIRLSRSSPSRHDGISNFRKYVFDCAGTIFFVWF